MSCSSSKKIAQLNNFKDNDVIELKVGQEYKMSVRENITTGYRWETQKSEQCAVTMRESYVVDKHEPGMVGVGGTKYFTIKADKVGECEISFTHGRGGVDVIDSKKLKFVVK